MDRTDPLFAARLGRDFERAILLDRDLGRAILFDHPEAVARAARRLMRRRGWRPWADMAIWLLAGLPPASRPEESAALSRGLLARAGRFWRLDPHGLWRAQRLLGESFAMRAAHSGKFKALGSLLECGADPWALDADGSDLSAAILSCKPSWTIDESARSKALEILSASRCCRDRCSIEACLAPSCEDLALAGRTRPGSAKRL